ncbi:hypothetical protein [Aeromicrobium sp. UC242_57]|uniref:hypothetical protein n=1 Tax=Aeromicrobium sp. UC242_57 TaxID=3374624 RepID=UPI00379B6B53
MHQVTLDMQMSSDDALATVVTALHAIPDVGLDAPGQAVDRHLMVTIVTDDPDVVDIVREITWQFDPLAIQHSLFLGVAS